MDIMKNKVKNAILLKCYIAKKSCIRDTKNLSTNVYSSTDKTNQGNKNCFFLRGDLTPFMSKKFQICDHFFFILSFKDSENKKKSGHYTLGSGGKRMLKLSEQIKKSL